MQDAENIVNSFGLLEMYNMCTRSVHYCSKYSEVNEMLQKNSEMELKHHVSELKLLARITALVFPDSILVAVHVRQDKYFFRQPNPPYPNTKTNAKRQSCRLVVLYTSFPKTKTNAIDIQK